MNATQNPTLLPLRLLAVTLLAGLWPVVVSAQPASPVRTGGTPSPLFIPFVKDTKEGLPFTDTPKLQFTVGGRTYVAGMDTGSVGVAISASQIDDYETLLQTEKTAAGTSFLSSSKILWVGHWVPMMVTFLDDQGKPVASAKVPVLGVEQEAFCPTYVSGNTCPGTPLKKASDSIHYMGVGFGREADHQPQGTPDKNPLLNIVSLGQTPTATQPLRRGYIITEAGVTAGLSDEALSRFTLIKLTADTQNAGDWQEAPMCISVNGSPCVSGNALIDTGIPQMYLTVPSTVKFTTKEAKDLSVRGRKLKVLAPKTLVEVRFPGSQDPKASYQFSLGDPCSTPAPAQAIPTVSDTKAPFVNTGRHFLRHFEFLYDADGGQVGLRKIESPKVAPGCKK